MHAYDIRYLILILFCHRIKMAAHIFEEIYEMLIEQGFGSVLAEEETTANEKYPSYSDPIMGEIIIYYL